MSESLTPFHLNLTTCGPFPCLPSIVGEGNGEKAVYSTYISKKPNSGLNFTAIRKKAATLFHARVTVLLCSKVLGPTQVTSYYSLGAATQLNQK